MRSAVKELSPSKLVGQALSAKHTEPFAMVALGKAAVEMARGAADLGLVRSGVVIAPSPATVAIPGVAILTGEHPVPGDCSFVAGERLGHYLENLEEGIDLVVLLSGGGSALCETPYPGIARTTVVTATTRLLDSAEPFSEMNLARSHLSMLKLGGISEVANRPTPTYTIADVAGADPRVVASGPTNASLWDPTQALEILDRVEVPLTPDERLVVAQRPRPRFDSPIALLADGFDLAQALKRSLPFRASVDSDWLCRTVSDEVDRATRLDQTPAILTGEPLIEVSHAGRGGRNTHAALLAAKAIAGTDVVFAAFASDGMDGPGASAGAVVDGTTWARCVQPEQALETFDSAACLEEAGGLLSPLPTGSNLGDVWLIFRYSDLE